MTARWSARRGTMGVHERSGSVLRPGQRVATAGGRHGTVTGLLGAGAQGEVHEVRLDGAAMALKLYHHACLAVDTTLRQRLTRAIARGAPTPEFLWPLDLVEVPGSGSFGYVMPLRTQRFRPLRDLIAAPPQRLELSLADRARVCLAIAGCFHELHASGFCYQDINFGSFFVDPATAAVLICDNDNVDVDGAEASIYGTRKFMAPEIVRREALPSSRTDLYSMAVLFFYILFGWHALDGRREAETPVLDAAAEMRLYGTEPLFVFDPADGANGPVPGQHDWIAARWASLGAPLRLLFERVFTSGLRQAGDRVIEAEWRPVLRAAIDGDHRCTCGWERILDVRAAACPACGSDAPMPPFLRVGRRQWAMTPGRTIERDALGLGAGPGASVEPHPTRPELVGLRNLSDATWRATQADGRRHVVEPSRAVRVEPGMQFDFGRARGVVQGLSG